MKIDKMVDAINSKNGWDFMDDIVTRVKLIRMIEGDTFTPNEVFFVNSLFTMAIVKFMSMGMSRKLATALSASHKKKLASLLDDDGTELPD